MPCQHRWLVRAEQNGEEDYVFVLKDILQQAQNDGRAVGHFNIADFVMLKAVFAQLSSREPVTFLIFSCFLHIQAAVFQAPRQSRHPEQSASQIYRK
jgi:thymidylate synthase